MIKYYGLSILLAPITFQAARAQISKAVNPVIYAISDLSMIRVKGQIFNAGSPDSYRGYR